uniref:Uncharacterized protein n=1 Tax=Onchocerca volvulus TaxID=6282 RepID=A0A8R1XYP9_ONCVO
MYQYDIMECVFAAPVLFPDNSNNSNISVIVTQSSSLFLLQTDTLQLLWYIRIDGIGSFPRPPEILNSTGYLFIQDSSGTLLAIKRLRNLMRRNTDLEIPTIEIFKVLKVPGETFGGVRILKTDETDISNSNSSNSGCSCKTTIASYRALIGSRDDRVRCFYFSL